MSSIKRSGRRANRKRRYGPMTKERRASLAAAAQRRIQNQKKLEEFLSGERKAKVSKPFLGPANFVMVEVYADPVIQAFYEHGRMISTSEFDPKAEYERFINSYLERFSPRPNKAKPSRTGTGGPNEKALTLLVRAVLEAARDEGESITKQDVIDRTFAQRYPNKDKEKAPSTYRTHKRDVSERLGRESIRKIYSITNPSKKRGGSKT